MQKRLLSQISILLMLLFIVALSSCAHSGSKQRHRILVIQSYEQEYSGYAKVEHDIFAELKKQNHNIELHFFYLDCDSYNESDEKTRIYNFLDTIQNWNPEVILVYDDQATYSLFACQHPFVKEVPVVFAGVNFPNWNIIKQYPNVTGLWDRPEFIKTSQMIEKLFGPMKINIWMDNTYLGRQTTDRFFEEIKTPKPDKPGNFKYIVNEDRTITMIPDSLSYTQMIKPSKMFYALINSRESSSNSLLWSLSGLARNSVFVQSKRDFSSKRLGLYADAPTFTVVNEGFGFKEGIIGGYITSYETQIKESVNIVTQILKGCNVENIPIKRSPKEYILDWADVERWSVSRNDIPANYNIINMPFHTRYKSYIVSFGSFLILAILSLISYLTYLYLRENKNKRQALEKLKKGERFLSLAVVGGKVFAFELNDKQFSFDKEFYTFVGITEKDFTLHEFEAYIYPEDLTIFKQSIIDAYAGINTNNITRFRCNFNNQRYQWWEFRYIYNKEKDIFNGLCFNIQKIKEAEQELIEARQKAEESDKMKSAFLANMSHEIRTPLNAIVGFSNIITEEDVELSIAEKKEIQDLISSNSDLLLKLINDILDLSRIESGKMEFTFAICNLTDLMNKIYHTHQLLMPSGVELKLEIPDQACMLETDFHRLTQVITNFINNASKFTQNGYIKIGYINNPEQKMVDIFVEDTGIGIPLDKQQGVFERFNKLDEFAQGTGLGLAICQIIIQRFGGKIQLLSEEKKGSRFTITLPLHSPA